jgi:hypothetical protein
MPGMLVVMAGSVSAVATHPIACSVRGALIMRRPVPMRVMVCVAMPTGVAGVGMGVCILHDGAQMADAGADPSRPG